MSSMCGLSPRFSWMTRIPGARRRRVGGTREVPAHRPRPVRRGILQIFLHDARVVGRDLLRLGELGAQLVEQHGRRDAADGELLGPVEEGAAIDPPVDVGVEEDEQFLVEVVRGLAFHGCISGGGLRLPKPHRQCAARGPYAATSTVSAIRRAGRRERRRAPARYTTRTAMARVAPRPGHGASAVQNSTPLRPSAPARDRISTYPAEPCTRIRSPSLMRCVARSTATTAGMPYSRAITAPWVICPPTSVTKPPIATNSGSPTGIGIRRDEDVARREVAVGELPHDARAPFHDSGGDCQSDQRPLRRIVATIRPVERIALGGEHPRAPGASCTSRTPHGAA